MRAVSYCKARHFTSVSFIGDINKCFKPNLEQLVFQKLLEHKEKRSVWCHNQVNRHSERASLWWSWWLKTWSGIKIDG